MKRLTLLFITGLSLAGTAWAQQAGSTPASHPSPPPGAPPAGGGQMMFTSDQLQELHAARSAAINAHPDLIADMEKLMGRMRALNDKIDAAMIKIDPGVAPILAKIKANRNRQPPGVRPTPTPPPANPPPG